MTTATTNTTTNTTTIPTGTSASAGVSAVRRRYDALSEDLRFVASATMGEPTELAAATAFVAFESRLLDQGRFASWLALWADDGLLWVPLTAAAHPATDQAFFLDDVRRLRERVGRFADPSAWSANPTTTTTRVTGAVEAWRIGADVIAQVPSTLHIHRLATVATYASTITYRLRPTGDGLRIVHKIIVVPALQTGVTDLSVLL